MVAYDDTSRSLRGMFKLTSFDARPPPHAAEITGISPDEMIGFCFSFERFGAAGMLASENVAAFRFKGENTFPAVESLREIERSRSCDFVDFLSESLLALVSGCT